MGEVLIQLGYSHKMSCLSPLLVIVLFGLVSHTWSQGFRLGGGSFRSSSGSFRSSSGSFRSSSGSSFGSSSLGSSSSNNRFGSSSSFGSSGSFGSSSSNSGDYIASWDHGANSLTWHQGKSWCQARGRRLVSLDSNSKARRYFSILSSGQEASNLFLVLLYPERLSGGRMETLRPSLEDLSLGQLMVNVVLNQMEEARRNASPSST